jgi:hypothetical protein
MPLNRIAKPDTLAVRDMVHQEVAKMRADGGWDSELGSEKRWPSRSG